MFEVELRFANHTERQTFASRADARKHACALCDMFRGEEIWLDNATYIVTVPAMEIVICS